MLFHAHSGLRYLVLLVGLVHLVVALMGFMKKAPINGLGRALSAAFMGLLHTQVLLGLAMVAMGRYYPALIGHMVMMIVAAVLATVMHVRGKRAQPSTYLWALIGTGGSLALIVGGVMAIGRGLFQMTAGS